LFLPEEVAVVAFAWLDRVLQEERAQEGVGQEKWMKAEVL